MLRLEVHRVAARLGVLNEIEVVRGKPKWLEEAIAQLDPPFVSIKQNKLHRTVPHIFHL